jgi:hypothetical protein
MVPNRTITAGSWDPDRPGIGGNICGRRIVITAHDERRHAFAAAMTDAYIAVFEAKYHHELWRPITAIRNGDIDGNPVGPQWDVKSGAMWPRTSHKLRTEVRSGLANTQSCFRRGSLTTDESTAECEDWP